MLFERPNQLWVGDYHEVPILFDPRTECFRTVHLAAFIDHYSKYVPYAQWHDNERIATLEDTFTKGLLKRVTTVPPRRRTTRVSLRVWCVSPRPDASCVRLGSSPSMQLV